MATDDLSPKTSAEETLSRVQRLLRAAYEGTDTEGDLERAVKQALDLMAPGEATPTPAPRLKCG